MESRLIRPFSQIGKEDAGLAGGKGASLGEMTQAGIPVPPGFVILASTFERFIEETDLVVEIEAALDSVKHEEMHTVEYASEKIQALIHQALMPEDIASDIRKHFTELGAEFVAVRSSATAEDSASAAWAGQLDTYLNTTEEELLTNVQRCWASLFTPRAIFYRFEKGLHATKISVAVVVQKMVNSDASGIAFSVHPVTEDYNQLIIEAGFGLGEAIVSGQITPDSYVVTKIPREIIDKNIATKERGMFRKEGGGNEWKELAKDIQETSTLTDAQILALSEAVIGIEKHYGFPCDIEWAMEAGVLYITQSRPITTLSSHASASQSSSSLVEEITKRTWFKSWEAQFPLFLVSMGAPGYFHSIKEAFGFELGHFLVTTREGILAGYWVEEELIAFGTHLSKLAEKEPRLLTSWSKRLKKETDTCRALMRRGKSYFLSKEHFEKLRTVDEVLSAYQIAVREVINYLSDELREKYAPELERARRHSETIFFELSELVSSVLVHVAEKEKIQPARMGCVTVDELEAYFEGSPLPDSSILKERYQSSGFVNHPEFSWLSGNDIAQIEQSFVEHSSDEVHGQTGYQGKITGRARVIKNFSIAHEFVKGDILVTGMTDPNYVPIMEKAGAIVTDAGGLLCHAAIIAREMKKPCVIGTKIATKIFTDGDLIEVDADTGIVRILEKASPKKSITLAKMYSREKPLFYFALWQADDREGMKRYLDIDIKDDLYIVPPPGEQGSIWFPGDEFEHLMKVAFEKINSSREFADSLIVHARKYWALVRPYLVDKKRCETAEEMYEYYRNLVEFWIPMNSVFFMLPDRPGIDPVFKDNILTLRNETQEYTEEMPRVFTDFFAKRFPTLTHLAYYISPEETLVLDKELKPELLAELEIRAQFGCFMFGSGIYPMSKLDGILKDSNLVFEKLEGDGSELIGQTAYKGKVEGPVCLVLSKADMKKVKPGDILVTPMTNPDTVPVMKIAGAVVTDEGGLTCHAAIASRELRVPCVVGTKFATQVLKDGDRVEVDAGKGMVRKI